MHSPRNDIENLCKTQYVGWSGTLPCNDRTNSCKAQVVDGTATFPLSLCVREQLLTSERVFRDAGEGVIGCQDVKLLSVLHTKITSVTSLLPALRTSVLLIVTHPSPIGEDAKPTYSPIHLFSYSPRKRAAFTLAEVLITLGIIGVVAAMTMPSLISKYQEKVWLSAFKKSYSVLSQAYLRASEDYGTANMWCAEKNTDCGKKYFDILSPYLNIGQIWGYDRPNLFNKASYRDLDGRGMGPVNAFTTSHYKFALSDGTVIGISDISSQDINSALLQVDINGFRGPNQLGKDFFYFSLIRRDDSPVVGGYSLWWLYDNVYCKTEKGSGWWSGGGCSLWIISTGNMDYLHRNLTLDEWQNAVKNLLLDLHKDSLD